MKNTASAGQALHDGGSRGRAAGRRSARFALVVLILSACAAGCFYGPPHHYGPRVYGAPSYVYTPPVYNYRGYGPPPVVVERRSAFGGYAAGRSVWADTVRGRDSYRDHEERHHTSIHQPQAYGPPVHGGAPAHGGHHSPGGTGQRH